MLNSASLRLRLLAGAALTVAIASPVLAVPAPTAAKDTAPATAAADPVIDPAPAAVEPADQTGLGEIVVTATKRETNLQKTPIAINVLSSQALTDRHVQSLYDLADGAVPSLRVATFEARQSALTIGIRGIVPLDANQPAREQGVGVYIDGVYLGRQHGLNAALFDVDRIEVLKGPQGTLFGRNTEGGALSIVTKGPSGKWGGSATGGIANYGSYNGSLHLDLPETYGVALKLDGVIQHQDATTKNPLEGQTGFNYYHRRGFKATARVHPISGMTADFSYDNGYDSNSPFYSQLLNVNPNGCKAGAQSASSACTLPGTNYTTLTGTVKPLPSQVVVNGTSRAKVADIGVPQQPSVDKTHGFTSNIRWDVAPEIELRSITAWRGVNATQYDNSGGYHRVPVVAAGCTGTACNFSRYSLADLHQNQFSQEFQAVGTVGQFDYVAGLYYFNEHISDDAATPNSLAFNSALTTISVLDPCTGSGGFGSLVGCRSIDRASEVHSKSYAGYGQVTWNATDRVHLTAGGRYTRDEKQGVLHYSRNLNYDTATAAQLTAAGYKPLDATWNRFNPMATLAYDASDSVHVYAKYATGYRAGGASSRTSNYQTFNPEDVKSYEIGAKTDFWNHRARLNLAGYIMDRKNSQVDISSIQTTASGSFNNLVTINAPGITKIRGIEADLTVQPVDGLTLTAGYAYTYTKIPPVLIASTGVYQNFYIVFTPRNAANGSIDYTMPISDMDLKFHLDGNYSQATQTFDQFATKNDPAFIANARLALANIHVGGSNAVTVSAWVRNLFDKQYVFRRDPSNSLPGAPTTNLTSGSVNNVLGDYGNFNAPRTYGMEASVKF
ncbi:iron complex outermembrane receptor protein [Sphingomonas sp. PP-F2F-A104-K0414]|uniref:TonB-dependent receptor n=1 Tax=Sphingomonas sp. PP-F2F-A104-K0414 TaxID=2135661 RepID=UPI00104978E1|nr:TonB-dependent receptor [Sphingomonas sp. PP-F2F-A104-K0414]TCP98907.1 iron complex outermembrane receptor protein [Sphingomonas sp. PP-F2F-A104-K0414]